MRKSAKYAVENILVNNTKSNKIISNHLGDQGRGYNFGVLTCESCKSFFRRHFNRDWHNLKLVIF